MRIWYQSLFDGGRMPAYFSGLQARAKRIARPGVKVEFHGMPQGVYGAHAPSVTTARAAGSSAFTRSKYSRNISVRAQARSVGAFTSGSRGSLS